MARCKRCGRDTGYKGPRVCTICMKTWKENRFSAFEQAEKIHGKLCADNHKAIVKTVKKIEKELKAKG